MKYSHIFAVVSALLLSSCASGTVKETLGLGRSAPDEYRVVSRPPLSVPPQFALRPPATSDTSPSQLSADQQAKSLVLGKDGTPVQTGTVDTAVIPVTTSSSANHGATNSRATATRSSGAESQFLKNAGADKADPKVRDSLVEEKFAVQEEQEESHWWNPMSWSGADKKEPLVDAKKEADRIKNNEDEGKPVTTGATPETKASDTGVLGKVLGY